VQIKSSPHTDDGERERERERVARRADAQLEKRFAPAKRDERRRQTGGRWAGGLGPGGRSVSRLGRLRNQEGTAAAASNQ